MKNTLLTFDKIENDLFICEDYTSKKFTTTREMDMIYNSDYIDYIELIDNQTIEQISYTLYGTSDYWDILIIINNRDPLFEMSYDFDILLNITNETIDKYTSDYSGMYLLESLERLKTNYLSSLEEINEERRTMKIIKPSKISEFIKKYREMRLEEDNV